VQFNYLLTKKEDAKTHAQYMYVTIISSIHFNFFKVTKSHTTRKLKVITNAQGRLCQKHNVTKDGKFFSKIQWCK